MTYVDGKTPFIRRIEQRAAEAAGQLSNLESA
jgi:hypothetical protein